MRHGWENKDVVFNAVEISIPVSVMVFPDEIFRALRSWAECNNHELIYLKFDAGSADIAILP
jgi:hypothetical protein